MGKEVVEIVYVNSDDEHNIKAARELSKELEGERVSCALVHQPSLNKAANYIKSHFNAVGLISYCSSTENIKSRGVDVINKFNLFINGVKRMRFKDITKYFFVLSAGQGFKMKFPSIKEKNWATFVVVEKKRKKFKHSDIVELLSQNDIFNSFLHMRTKSCYLYFELHCCAEELKSISQVKGYKIKILGSYELPK